MEPTRIALIKPSALGDIMNSLPVLTALRRRFTSAHISWIVNRSYEPLLRGHPDLNDIIVFERRPLSGFLAMGRFLRTLRQHQFDLAIDLQGLLRTGLIALATGAPRRIGLSTAREGASWFYTEVVDDRGGSPHAVERYWHVAEHLGAAEFGKTFRLPENRPGRDWALSILKDLPRPWLALGVGSRWVTKRWPPEHFAELARRALREFGGSVIFIGTPDEAELARHTAELISGPKVNVAGATTLTQLAGLLAQVDVLIANDTGPLHLAVALGRPIVAPYTCTKVSHNGPFGQEDHAVETKVYCQGSYLRRCGRLDCMAELTPDRLWPIMRGILDSWANQRQIA